MEDTDLRTHQTPGQTLPSAGTGVQRDARVPREAQRTEGTGSAFPACKRLLRKPVPPKVRAVLDMAAEMGIRKEIDYRRRNPPLKDSWSRAAIAAAPCSLLTRRFM